MVPDAVNEIVLAGSLFHSLKISCEIEPVPVDSRPSMLDHVQLWFHTADRSSSASPAFRIRNVLWNRRAVKRRYYATILRMASQAVKMVDAELRFWLDFRWRLSLAALTPKSERGNCGRTRPHAPVYVRTSPPAGHAGVIILTTKTISGSSYKSILKSGPKPASHAVADATSWTHTMKLPGILEAELVMDCFPLCIKLASPTLLHQI